MLVGIVCVPLLIVVLVHIGLRPICLNMNGLISQKWEEPLSQFSVSFWKI